MKMKKRMRDGIRMSWCVILAAGLLLSGCSQGEEAAQNDIQTAVNEESGAAGEGGEQSAAEPAEGSGGESLPEETPQGDQFEEYVEWAVPNLIEVTDETLARFNQMLAERGFDFGLRLNVLEYSLLDNSVYQDQLLKASSDIAFAGLGSSEGADLPLQLISSGFFDSLDSYLPGSDLYAAVPEQMWNSVRYEGSVYTIPTGAATDGGICIYFDLDKISREAAESFQGDVTKLPELLGEDGKLLYSEGQFSYVSYYGGTYWNGVVVTQEGEVSSVFDHEGCMEWLRVMNQLYLSGRAVDDERADWSILIDNSPTEKENVYCYSTKDILNTRYAGSTGIVSASEKKEKAFRLLELLHTDSELGNCLIYGADYREKDGYAVDAEGNVMSGDLRKIVFGLNESVLWDQLSAVSIKYNSIQDKLDYFAGNVLESPVIGMTFETDTVPIKQILSMTVEDSLWKSRDLEGEIARLRTLLEETDLQKLIDEIKAALSEG